MSGVWRASACPAGHWPLPAGGVRGPLILDLRCLLLGPSLQGWEGFAVYRIPDGHGIPAVPREPRGPAHKGKGQAVPAWVLLIPGAPGGHACLGCTLREP